MTETPDMASEIQELTWALIDEQATESQVRRLEELLLEDHEARQVYVMCMQMHADLHYLLSGRRPTLPAAVEQAIAAEKKKKTKPAAVPLPLVDLSPLPACLPIVS